jgi:transposase InsO family protein
LISVPDRRKAIALIDEARAAGARLGPACAALGLTARTYQRWTAEGAVQADGRPEAERPMPAHALTEAEVAAILEVCHRPEWADLPPAQIIARLLDEEGRYIASEASFYRVLRAHGEQKHRGRAKAPVRQAKPTTYRADRPCEVWSWDVTWLPGPVRGQFYYLFLILDLYSRKIVGWEVHSRESAALGAEVVERAVLAEGCLNQPLVLHSDNGSPMKGATMLETLRRLEIEPSFSRPRVSNDNPFSEAVFRTCKYVPDFPAEGFSGLEAARAWVHAFVRWYNEENRHSRIRYVTPQQRHNGEDAAILAKRQAVYEQAKAENPRRWSGGIRDWNPAGPVWLNPEREPQKGAGKAAA